MTTHNSGLPEGGAYQGNQQQQQQQQQQAASRATSSSGGSSSGSRGFSTEAYQQQHAQASRTAALSHQAALGVHPAAASLAAANPLTAAGYSSSAAAAHLATQSGSSVVLPGSSGMPRMDMRQQQQHQQQQQRSAAARYHPGPVSMQSTAISAAVAVLTGAAGNDRVSHERPHHQSLAVQVQRDTTRQHQHQQQQQHAAVAAAASALRQQQHQQHNLGLPVHHQAPSHLPAHHHPPPHASRPAAHAAFAMHNRQQQVTAATIAQQQQQQQHTLQTAHPHYVHHRRHHHPHHAQNHHHPHHTTSHIPQQQQQQVQRVRDHQAAASRRAQVVAAAQAAAAQQTARSAQVATSLANHQRRHHPSQVVHSHAPAHVHPKDVAASRPLPAGQPPPQQQQPHAHPAAAHAPRSLPPAEPAQPYPPPPVAADLVDQFDDPHPPPRQHPPAPTNHRTAQEERIVQQRSVLVDRYAPFIAASDKSLGDARKRLQKAHEQVQLLRAAFTKQVYGKYRVCLRPPQTSEETLTAIKADPVAAARRLEQEIRQLKQEKEYEKKEATSVNAEMSKLDSAVIQSIGADNADQIMYISAGLSLVILPEEKDVDPKILAEYEDRGPVQLGTDQRVKNISQAAASAGQIIVERTRKAVGVRELLLQRRSLLSNQEHSSMLVGVTEEPPLDPRIMEIIVSKTKPVSSTVADSKSAPNVESKTVEPDQPAVAAKAAVAVTVPVPKTVPTPPKTEASVPPSGPTEPQSTVAPVSAPSDVAKVPQKKMGSTKISAVSLQQQLSAAKFGRGGAGISVNISLSLNPTADELSLDPDKSIRASTAALLSRGASTAQGTNKASPQQRLKHPHPESSGGKQRASSATSAKKELASLTHAVAHPQSSQHQHSYLSLALPPLPTTLERREKKPLPCVEHRCTARAKKAIQSVLGHLDNAPGSGPVTKIGALYRIQQSRSKDAENETTPGERLIDPSLAFSVLQAIGLVTENGKKDAPDTPPSVLLDKKATIVLGGDKRKLSSLTTLNSSWSRIGFAKRPRLSDAFKSDKDAKESTVKREPVMRSPSVENIRGGGELMSDANNDDPNGASESDSRKGNHRSGNAAYNNHVSANNISQGVRQAQPRWEDPSRQSLAVINSQFVAGNQSIVGGNHGHVAVAAPVAQLHQAHQAPANNDAYHQASNFNAMQLAHQLRQHASNHSNQNHNMAAMQSRQQGQGDLQQVPNYFTGMHPSAAWSSMGNSAAAMAAAQSSLAAMGLSVPMGVYDTAQDRAARAILVREQQNVAAAHAVAAHQQSMANSAFVGGAANPGFAPTPSSVANASTLLNSSSYRVGAQGNSLQAPVLPQQTRNDILAAASMMAQRDNGYRRAGADAPGNSIMQAQLNASTAPAPAPQKRKADSPVVETAPPAPSQTSENKASLPSAAKKPRPNDTNDTGVAVSLESKVAAQPAKSTKSATTSEPNSVVHANVSQSLQPSAAPPAKTLPLKSQESQPAMPRGGAPSTATAAPSKEAQPSVASANNSVKVAPPASSVQAVPSQPSLKAPTTQSVGIAATNAASGQTPVVQSKVLPSQSVARPSSTNVAPNAIAQTPKVIVPQQAKPPERKNHVASVGTKGGLQIAPTAAPTSLSSEYKSLVQAGKAHEAIAAAASEGAKVFPTRSAGIVEFLVSAGTSVPIPKAVVASSLKDRLIIPGFKNLATGAGFVVPREAVIAVILVWLWKNHEADFQRAFTKSGRIDVDPTCKWLVHAATDASVRALKHFISESVNQQAEPVNSATDTLLEGFSDSSIPSDAAAVLVVSRTLTADTSIVVDTDYALSQFHALTRFLDDCRLSALHSRSQERVLLASLISLKSTMSESFAHAYVSSMVRAGDALGHEELAEIVSDEEMKLSSMLPYDILRDQQGNWEDPCRPAEGYSPNLTGDVLTKVAHARAMIQKSLRRLQDRHNIKGGTPTFGAYIDPLSGQGQSTAPGSAASTASSKAVNGTSTPKTWSRRKGATMFVAEGPVPNGTGSAQATNWSLYDPKHYSAPLLWNCDAAENTPYGSTTQLKRSGSMQGANLKKKGPSATDAEGQIVPKEISLGRTTHGIDWHTIADYFDHVKLPGSGGGSAPQAPAPVDSATPAPNLKTIVSPFCRVLEHSPVASDDESDTEEDLSDESVLARHQIVLDGMKEKLTAFMEARKRQQERKKNRQKSNS
ncbi:expressed unknown protein [Seminavis robusta]|uniref:Uncharacterized protein n=1 Tax=Seminavis robusta TaxID=568900 RepID=A0A9N8DEB8_9STRA|nr:expressed unknown protein [Seminavis robusta]|eukprot:Sro79_g042700.1 n/a (2185) ;mRNA; f:43236-49961